MNQCQRCSGLMYVTKFWDLSTSGEGFFQWICINCGNSVDETVLTNRTKLQCKTPKGTKFTSRSGQRNRSTYALPIAK